MNAPRKKKLLLALVLASLAGLGGCVALVFQDEPPPDDSDLVLVRREVHAEENGFLSLDLSSEDIYWPDDEELVLAGSADFDVDAAREVVERNAAILEKLDECLARPEFLKDAGGAADTKDEKACENWDEPTFEVEF